MNYLVDLLEKCESNMHQTISNNNEGRYESIYTEYNVLMLFYMIIITLV